MHNAIEGNGIFNVMFVDGDEIGLSAVDAERFHAAPKELLVRAGGEVM